MMEPRLLELDAMRDISRRLQGISQIEIIDKDGIVHRHLCSPGVILHFDGDEKTLRLHTEGSSPW